jgi:hypothetical protein
MLFKYLPSTRIDVIENLLIRFSQIKSLNDPFESRPLVESLEIKISLINAIATGLKSGIKDQNLANFTDQFIDTIDSTIHNHYLSPQALGKQFINKLENIGILSLSRTETSLLMWSHYAENGKGFVLGLDTESTFFRKHQGIEKSIPVVYSKKRKIFDITNHNTNNLENITNIFCRKPFEWAYEEEERYFRYLCTDNGDIDTKEKDVFGENIFLTRIPADTIKKIFIGYNTSEEDKEIVFEAIKINKIDCKTYQSAICEKEYKVSFSEIHI